uniref:U-box domain-containing protein n=1 Tax=Alexandrium monilatum TaxID=311494 RepID=A0A7S4QFA2_9DINO
MEPPPVLGPQHPAVPGLAVVARSAASQWLLRAVGADRVTVLQHKLAYANGFLTSPPTTAPGAEPSAWLPLRQQAFYELARECIGLPAAVERGFNDGTLGSAGAADDDSADNPGWDFGVAVAEATAGSLAAFAEALEPQRGSDALEILGRLSLDLDYFAAHVFGGLSRLGAQEQCLGPGEERLLLALEGVCAWALVAVGRSIGYSKLTPAIFWEWACGDALWAQVLAKGALALPPAAGQCCGPGGLPVPADVARLQEAVLAATLGLARPSVAFGENGLSASAEDEAVPVAIAGRNEELVRHRSDLAAAAVSCKLVQVLITAASRMEPAAFAPGLAAFLVALLQPELARYGPEAQSSALAAAAADVLIGAPSAAAVEAVAQASGVSRVMAEQLLQHGSVLWVLLGEALRNAAAAPPGFLRDSADLAYLAPPSADALQVFLDAALASAGTRADPTSLAALCAVAANAGATPGAGGPLVPALARLSPDARATALARWERWRGPIRPAGLGQWAMVLQMQAEADAAELQAQAAEAPASPAPATAAAAPADAPAAVPPRPQRGRGTVLQDLVADAPAEFRCAYDGQLMMDPVRSPQGLTFERAGLAHILAVLGGFCPVSGCPLTLDECVRVPELRLHIARWVREQRAASERQPRRPLPAA